MDAEKLTKSQRDMLYQTWMRCLFEHYVSLRQPTDPGITKRQSDIKCETLLDWVDLNKEGLTIDDLLMQTTATLNRTESQDEAMLIRVRGEEKAERNK